MKSHFRTLLVGALTVGLMGFFLASNPERAARAALRCGKLAPSALAHVVSAAVQRFRFGLAVVKRPEVGIMRHSSSASRLSTERVTIKLSAQLLSCI